MIQDTVSKFVENDVKPKFEEIEKLDYELTKSLMLSAGELGLMGVDISDEYGGVGMDKISATIVSEELGKAELSIHGSVDQRISHVEKYVLDRHPIAGSRAPAFTFSLRTEHT